MGAITEDDLRMVARVYEEPYDLADQKAVRRAANISWICSSPPGGFPPDLQLNLQGPQQVRDAHDEVVAFNEKTIQSNNNLLAALQTGCVKYASLSDSHRNQVLRLLHAQRPHTHSSGSEGTAITVGPSRPLDPAISYQPVPIQAVMPTLDAAQTLTPVIMAGSSNLTADVKMAGRVPAGVQPLCRLEGCEEVDFVSGRLGAFGWIRQDAGGLIVLPFASGGPSLGGAFGPLHVPPPLIAERRRALV
ncbi:unnamed protein product [Effrenium voratum]|nr:unnamed protein product [Effrenium voratum]